MDKQDKSEYLNEVSQAGTCTHKCLDGGEVIHEKIAEQVIKHYWISVK